jgi:hypothetical protein
MWVLTLGISKAFSLAISSGQSSGSSTVPLNLPETCTATQENRLLAEIHQKSAKKIDILTLFYLNFPIILQQYEDKQGNHFNYRF